MRATLRAAVVLALLIAAWFWRGSEPRPDPRAPGLARFVTHRPWIALMALGLIGVAIASIVIVSGVVPIKASSGHWRITAALLDFAKARSVNTHSLGIDAPALDDPVLVLRGAGHYESGCHGCHGGPGGAVSPVMGAMTPPPPVLSRRVERWEAHELFSIVKHGVKFTGMPAWPAQQRDDEVWAMVAFLRELPRLDGARYRRLVYGEQAPGRDLVSTLPASGDVEPPRAVRGTCWRCHGVDGTGRGQGAFPSLAGQRAAYLYASLRAFADRTRFSGIMTSVAAQLGEDTMREAAAYYAGLPARAPEVPGDEPAIVRGRSIAMQGMAAGGIPSCVHCHGPSDAPRNPAYPNLAGQHARYLALQLRLFKERRRGGSAYVNTMHVFVDRLTPEQIQDVTAFYATSEPRDGGR